MLIAKFLFASVGFLVSVLFSIFQKKVAPKPVHKLESAVPVLDFAAENELYYLTTSKKEAKHIKRTGIIRAKRSILNPFKKSVRLLSVGFLTQQKVRSYFFGRLPHVVYIIRVSTSRQEVAQMEYSELKQVFFTEEDFVVASSSHFKTAYSVRIRKQRWDSIARAFRPLFVSEAKKENLKSVAKLLVFQAVMYFALALIEAIPYGEVIAPYVHKFLEINIATSI